MTRHAHLKERIRARMARTGERYAAARRHVLAQRAAPPATVPTQDSASQDSASHYLASALPAARAHRPGLVPATTALGILLDHAGIRAPHTDQPFSDAMLFGITGGIGIGVFSFYYEREDVATFFVGGRHHWYDDARYLTAALARLGMTPNVQESGGAGAAAAQLRAMLAAGPCIAWVDSAGLPHRAAPDALSGAGYHVITVYAIDDANGTALIGDMADDPVEISLDALADARARIKKDRRRLLGIAEAGALPPLATLVLGGLRACREGLLHPALPANGAANARLEALGVWAERMEGSRAKERWERVYRPGRNFFRGLCAIHDFIEHYGTGGGLCRPLFADFLAEAAVALDRPALARLGAQYAALGQAWSTLADNALPDDAPLLREAKELLTRKATLIHAGGPPEAIQATWACLAELEDQAGESFPLSDADCRALRTQLREQIAALYAGETAAFAAIPYGG
jgi:hypothetical protein